VQWRLNVCAPHGQRPRTSQRPRTLGCRRALTRGRCAIASDRVVAPFATAWTTTHQFAVSRTDWALSRGESSLGSAAHSRRTAQARNRRLRTHGVAVPGGAAQKAVTDLAYTPRESPRPIHMHVVSAVTVRDG
jgi:hypothetical protein